MAFLGQEEQLRELQDRFRYLYIAMFICLGLLTARLVYLQVLQGEKLRNYSEENRIKRVKIASPRGMVFDRNRTLLLDNRPSFDLEITPQYLSDSGRKDEVIDFLAALVGMTKTEIRDRLEKSRNQQPFLPVKIKTDMTRDEVAVIESWRLSMPGVAVETEIERTNTYGDMATHLLGYIGKITPQELEKLKAGRTRYASEDSIGKLGIEKQMESTLRGSDGEDLVEVDAVGRRIQSKSKTAGLFDRAERPSVPGKNLVLTIDQDLQIAALTAFAEKVGGLVALNPKNGEILAMVSRPSFDPTAFSRGVSPQKWSELVQNPDRPLRDKTLQDHYPPGSTFKAIAAIAALEEGVITPNFKVHCVGKIQVGNRTYHCHEKHGHGEVDVVTALTRSCDIFFYRVAQKFKSIDVLGAWARKFGYGTKTGVDLANEVPGLVPTEAWKMEATGQPWQAGESLSVVIGQGYMLSTVLQLANSYAAIANGGMLFKPRYVKAVESAEGEKIEEQPVQEIGRIKVSPETLRLVRQGLWGVVNSPRGTAASQKLPGMDMAGKTGTSQVAKRSADKIYEKCTEIKYRLRHHGLFVAFAPAHDPQIVVAVLAEHACSGSRGAAPIGREVVKTYLQKYFPEKYSDEMMTKATEIDRKNMIATAKAARAASEAKAAAAAAEAAGDAGGTNEE